MSEVNGDKAVGEGETGRLKLNIIGAFSASVDGHDISLGRKAQALLGYMMLSSARQLPRAKLVGLLWSEKDDPLAKGSLRQSLSQIQRELQARAAARISTQTRCTWHSRSTRWRAT